MMIHDEVRPVDEGRGSDDERPREPSLRPEVLDVLLKLGETSDLAAQLRALNKDVGLRDRELMELAGVSRATLSRWRKEGISDRPPPIDDVRVIAVLLIKSGAMQARSVSGWLRSRNEGLNWHRPLEVLRKGDFALVLSAAEAASGSRIPVKRIPDSVAPDSASFAGVPSSVGSTSPDTFD
jgi:hypothetical protein